MTTRLLLLLCLSAACGASPEFLPPPFGPDGPSSTRLFFPTGLALLPAGGLLVANGNFNRAYDGGTLVSIRKAYLDGIFAKKNSCEKYPPPEFAIATDPAKPADCDDDISTHPGEVFGGAVMIGNYAGPLALNDAATVAFTASRDTATINAVTVGSDLSLACAPNAGSTTTDCRAGVVNLASSGVPGPYSIVAGDSIVPGQAPRRVLYVSSMTPRVDEVSGVSLYTSGVVAALDMADPTQVLFTMLDSSRYVASGTAVGSALFDPSRRELLLSGCFYRFGGGTGDPGTSRCVGTVNNYLRFLDVDAMGSAQVQLFDLYGDVLSTLTTAMVADNPLAPTALWMTLRNPDVLVKVELPTQPSVSPRVQRVVPLPISPADLVIIPRPGQADLIAVLSEKLGALVIYDTGAQQIVAQVENLGDSPFALKLISSDGVTARLAATVFRACRLALVEVPLDAPWQASLRGRAGVCQ